MRKQALGQGQRESVGDMCELESNLAGRSKGSEGAALQESCGTSREDAARELMEHSPHERTVTVKQALSRCARPIDQVDLKGAGMYAAAISRAVCSVWCAGGMLGQRSLQAPEDDSRGSEQNAGISPSWPAETPSDDAWLGSAVHRGPREPPVQGPNGPPCRHALCFEASNAVARKR